MKLLATNGCRLERKNKKPFLVVDMSSCIKSMMIIIIKVTNMMSSPIIAMVLLVVTRNLAFLPKKQER
jgi:hypothetical protein